MRTTLFISQLWLVTAQSMDFHQSIAHRLSIRSTNTQTEQAYKIEGDIMIGGLFPVHHKPPATNKQTEVDTTERCGAMQADKGSLVYPCSNRFMSNCPRAKLAKEKRFLGNSTISFQEFNVWKRWSTRSTLSTQIRRYYR